jgi:carbamoyl-phosphate synthase large subunit
MKRLLFTGGGGAGNELIWRLWHERYELYFADCDADAFHPSIPSGRHKIIPRAGAEMRNVLGRFINTQTHVDDYVDLIIPGVDEELPWLADLPHVMSPGGNYINTMLDKYVSMKVLRQHKVPVPNTWIEKPLHGRGSRGVTVRQEHLEGQEYTVMMCATHNKVLRCVVPVRVELKRGVTLRGVTEANQAVIDACVKIHHAIPAAGTYNIQCMQCYDSRVLPFEINPRISTTFCLGVAADVNPVAIWYDTDKSERPLQKFAERVTLRRYWHNEVIR